MDIDLKNPVVLVPILLSVFSNACSLLCRWLPEYGDGPDQVSSHGYAVFLRVLHNVALNTPASTSIVPHSGSVASLSVIKKLGGGDEK